MKTQLILMNQLIKTVKSHFRNEEEFMEKIGYSGLRFHRDEHLVLERDFEVLVDGLSINSQPDLIAYETLKLITLDVRGLDMLIPKSIAPEPI